MRKVRFIMFKVTIKDRDNKVIFTQYTSDSYYATLIKYDARNNPNGHTVTVDKVDKWEL